MLSLYRTLSLRYLSRRWFRSLLIVASIMLGVATLVATQALNDTMSRASVSSGNPVAGIVDLVVTNGELSIDRKLAKDIATVPGVKAVHLRIFDQAKIVLGGEKKPILIMGIDLAGDPAKSDEFATQFDIEPGIDTVKVSYATLAALQQIPAVVGKELDTLLAAQPDQTFLGFKLIHVEKGLKKSTLVRVASIEAKDKSVLASLGGHVILLDLDNAAKVLGLPRDQVRRIDVALAAGVDPKQARLRVEAVLKGRAEVRTIEEQNQALQSAMSGMKTGFSMCGVAALVVGMFLVYNSLSVSVAERRHEIGILLAVGATRIQVWRLFAGEALFLGSVGSALGIPLGLGMASLGLRSVQDAIGDVFATTGMNQIDLSRELAILAFVVGILSALFASMVPAVRAAGEQPAAAVRRVPREACVSHVIVHIGVTVLLILCGMGLIMIRNELPSRRFGAYGGLGLVMVGTLLAAPLCAHLVARALVPLTRPWFPIAWRLAADNLVRSPGRTGLVIGALAAGVCLVIDTAGIIESNRTTIHNWISSTLPADLFVTSGNAIGSGAPSWPMEESLGEQLRKFPEVEAVLPMRICTEIPYRDVRICLITTVADRAYAVEKRRLRSAHDAELLRRLGQERNAVIVSENFAALQHVRVGDDITLKSPKGEVKLHVIGTVVDYQWNLGTIMINHRDYVAHWDDRGVTVFDLYLRPGADADAVKRKIAVQLGAQYALFPLRRDELVDRIDLMITRLYGIAYAQQIVVIVVAALGVVTALLISVLQRRREMGLLRAIGGSRAQVVYLVLTEAFLMGVVGTFFGALFAIPLQWYSLQVVFLEESGFSFPIHIAWGETANIALIAIGIATFAGVGPALYAVRQRIPDAIAYE